MRKKQVNKSSKVSAGIQIIKKLWKKKQYLGLAAILGVIVITISAGIVTWFLIEDTVEKRKIEKIESTVKVVNEFKKPELINGSQSYDNKVLVENKGDAPIATRIKVTPKLSSQKKNYSADNTINILYHLEANSKWIFGEDGYYYYTEVIKPKAKSDKLFDRVNILIEDSNAFYGKHPESYFNLSIKVESADYRKNDYRSIWWDNRRKTPSKPKLQEVDNLLQKENE